MRSLQLGSLAPGAAAALVVFGAACACAAEPGAPSDTGAGASERAPTSLDATLEAIRARTGVPGIAAAAVRGGKLVALGVSGVREAGTDDPISHGDAFTVGSCTKAMTRLLIARLVDAGALSFETTLGEAFPGVAMRDEYKPVTLAQVMRHEGGLPSYERITPKDTPIMFELKGTARERRAQFVAHVLTEAPAAKPGSRMVYSNAGFALLGAIAEARAGASYEDLMTSRVFEPLGMASARIGQAGDGGARPGARGHFRTPDGFRVAAASPPVTGPLAPAGGARLNIGDFAKFAAYHAALEGGDGGELLKPATVERLRGLRASDASGREGEVFLGGEGTYTAGFACWASKDFGVVVCVNGGDSDEVCEEVVDAVRAAVAPDAAGRAAGMRPGPGLAPRAPAGPNDGPRLGAMMRAEEDGRLFVESLEPGSLAERSGFQPGDELLSIDGKALADWDREAMRPALRTPGARIMVRRDGQEIEVVVAKPGG